MRNLNESDINSIEALQRLLSGPKGKSILKWKEISPIVRIFAETDKDNKRIWKNTKRLEQTVKWSKQAIHIKETQPNSKLWGQHGLLHLEHIVPLKIVFDLMPEGEDCTIQAMTKLLSNLIEPVIVTKQEAKEMDKKHRSSMPDGWDGKDRYARLKLYDIDVQSIK